MAGVQVLLAGVKHRLEAFGLRRYGSRAAGRNIVYCCVWLVVGLVLLVAFPNKDGSLVGAPLGFVTGSGLGLLVLELVGLVRRRRHR